MLQRREGAVAWVTLNRPERLNAFAGGMRDELRAALLAAGAHPEVRLVVLTGAGRAFSAGADLEAMAGLMERGDEAGFARLLDAGAGVVRALRSLPCPVVAALNGDAAGAGAALATACDLRWAADGARIGFPFARLGLHPDWGSSHLLPRLVGGGRAAELLLGARMLTTAEAERAGLIGAILPGADFGATVRDRAGEIAALPPPALAAIKRVLAGDGAALDAALAAERAAQLRLFRTPEARAAVLRFLAARRGR